GEGGGAIRHCGATGPEAARAVRLRWVDPRIGRGQGEGKQPAAALEDCVRPLRPGDQAQPPLSGRIRVPRVGALHRPERCEGRDPGLPSVPRPRTGCSHHPPHTPHNRSPKPSTPPSPHPPPPPRHRPPSPDIQQGAIVAKQPEAQTDASKIYRTTIATEKGDIVLDLDPQLAPNTVNNFVGL